MEDIVTSLGTAWSARVNLGAPGCTWERWQQAWERRVEAWEHQ